MLRRIRFSLLLLLLYGCDCGDGGQLTNVHPDIEVDPASLDFGGVRRGDFGEETIRVANRGGVVLRVTEVRRAEDTHPAITFDTEPFEVAAGDAFEFDVGFVVTSLGEATGAVTFVSDDPDEPEVTVPITAEALPAAGPRLSLCVESEDVGLSRICDYEAIAQLGDVVLGEPVDALVTIESVGTEPLVVDASMSRSSHPFFVPTPSRVQTTLPSGERATVTVRFDPTETGFERAQLVVETNDADEPFAQVRLRGTGVERRLCAEVESVDFGAVELGMYVERELTFENCAGAPVVVDALTIEGTSELTLEVSPTLPLTMEPGARETITLRYTPTDVVDDEALLRIVSNAPETAVTLIARAESCQLAALPPMIDFGSTRLGEIMARSLVISNVGAHACEITDFAFSPSTTAEFGASVLPTVPTTIGPGLTETIELTYTPTELGVDSGEFLITDALGQTVTVQLAGVSDMAVGCYLAVAPVSLSFGAIAIGVPSTLGLQISNIGTEACNTVTLALSPGSGADFALAGPPTAWIPPGGQQSISVTFTPSAAGARFGSIIISGANPINVPLTGTGDGTLLCVTPNPVVFGTRPANSVTPRAVTLAACGSQDVVVSSLSLPAPTTSEMSIYTAPPLPLTIQAGATAQLELRYAGTNDGRDDGTLQITSNDVVAPIQDIDLIAHTSTVPCGDIQGRICDLDMAGPVVGATVYVDTPNGRISTTTNANGDYVLTCVPAGTYDVTAESGQWSNSSVATVTAYTTTVIPGQQCLDPTSANVAVIFGSFDNIEAVLAAKGIPYDFYTTPDALVLNPTLLGTYDIVFINCGWNEAVGLGPTSRANLTAYVSNGGSLYTSDWAYDIVEVLWPNAVDFHGDDNVLNSAQSGGSYSGLVDVLEPSLVAALNGQTQITMNACCVATTSAGPGTTVYLEAQRFPPDPPNPLMIGFSPTPTAGRVFHTDFHNNGQPDIETVFSWLLLNL
ncbi:MAG: choice-of-anchor D domain-containing protein [Deltaproteobacteria bacterium]